MESSRPTSRQPSPRPGLAGRVPASVYRPLLNLWPCIRRGGGWVTHLSPDFMSLTVRLRLTWRTRNLVGTIFGGSMCASTDPMFMLMLHRILGPAYVVWDKQCVARFKRPATRTLTAHFRITPEMLADVKAAVADRGEADFTWTVHYVDAAGTVHAEFDKTLYVADKAFYKRKQAARAATASAAPSSATAPAQ